MNTTPQPQNQPQVATVIQHPAVVPSNDTWISKYEGCGAKIKFGNFIKLLDRAAWRNLQSQKGLYAIYYIPDWLLPHLNTLPVVNDHAIYVGETNVCMYSRLYKFEKTLHQLVEHEVSGNAAIDGPLGSRNRHSGAIHFYNQIVTGPNKIRHNANEEFAGIDGYTLMIRVAIEQPTWGYETADHERSFLTAVRAINPPRLSNIR